MFEPTTRYMTCGIDNEFPPALALYLWSCIDKLLAEKSAMDYLQIFHFEKVDEEIFVVYNEQEQPERLTLHYMDMTSDYEKILSKKVYIIDDGDHSTMLFADEY